MNIDALDHELVKGDARFQRLDVILVVVSILAMLTGAALFFQ